MVRNYKPKCSNSVHPQINFDEEKKDIQLGESLSCVTKYCNNKRQNFSDIKLWGRMKYYTILQLS